MNDIRLLALDVDGTLAARGDEITPATREALHRADAAGIEVVIATGRRYRSTLRIVEALGMPVDIVCLGGALVKSGDGNTLHREHFDPADFAKVQDLAREHGQAVICQRDSAKDGGPDFVVDAGIAWNEQTRVYFELNDGWATKHDDLRFDTCPDALAMGAFGPEPDLRVLWEGVEQAHPELFAPTLVPSHSEGSWYLELTRREVSKWTGLRALAAELQLPTDAICAVGDQTNDLPMLREAGMAVAMGNAVEAVKAEAHWVTGRNDEDGIVAVVDLLLGD